MAVLNRNGIVRLVLLSYSLSLVGCSPTSVTKTYPLETDTYISSDESTSHAEFPDVKIAKSALREDRALLKLPTTDKDPDTGVNDTLEDTFLLLFFMPLYILSKVLACSENAVKPENLTKAELVLEVNDSQEAVAGKLELALLAKPWWQSVNWEQAHPFSSKGMWSLPGGDVDPAFVPVANTEAGGVVRFLITDYFKQLMLADGKGVHFGFMMKSANPTFAGASLHSTQASNIARRPRVEAVFSVTCGSSYGFAHGVPGTATQHRRVYILGDEPMSYGYDF